MARTTDRRPATVAGGVSYRGGTSVNTTTGRGGTPTYSSPEERRDALGVSGGSSLGPSIGGSYQDKIQGNLEDSFLADMLSSIPIIGSIFEPLKAMNDKQMAINHTGWEMEYNAREAEKNRQFQTSERLATQEWNEEMWNKQNEYNSLKSRLARASEAGVNPNAILGEGDTSAQQPHASTPMSGATAHYSSSLANQMFQASANLAKTRAEVQNISADTTNKEYEYDWNVLTESARHDLFINQAYDYKASGDLKGAEKDIAEGMYQIAKGKSQVELSILNQQLNNLRLQYVDMLKGIQYKDGQIKYIEQQTDNLEQQEMIIRQEQRLNEFMIQYSSATGLPFGTDEFNACFYLYATGQQDKYITARLLQTGVSPNTVEKVIDKITDDINPVIPFGSSNKDNNNDNKGKDRNKSKKRNRKSMSKRSKKFFSAISALNDYLKSTSVMPDPRNDPNYVVLPDGPTPLQVPFVGGPVKAFSPLLQMAGKRLKKAFSF